MATPALTHGEIHDVKLSLNLPEEDVRFIHEYVTRGETCSRSAAIHTAIGLLRNASLAAAYAEAGEEWQASNEAELWDATTADGLSDAER